MKSSTGLMAIYVCLFSSMLAIMIGCQAVPLHKAAPKPVPFHTGPKSQAEIGRRIYVSVFKCAKCHWPKPVYDYDRETWKNDILPRMAEKAKLKDEDYAALLAYVTSAQEPMQ